jgi:uncharacterized protein (DUF1697 family)
MTTYVALLRGINVGGNKLVAMADLRALVARLGFADVRTLLQSGNLVFRGDRRSPAQLERLLEAETERRLGIEVAYFVRTATEWHAVVARNPFRAEAARDPARLAVMVLKDAPAARAVAALRAAITGREAVRAAGRHLYAVYPDGMGRSRLTHTLIEKLLGTRATGRNWNTVRKLAELAAAI